MSDETRYVYSYGYRSARRILFGMFTVEDLGEQGLKYHPDWSRIWKITLGSAILAYLSACSLRYFSERYMTGVEDAKFSNILIYIFSEDARLEERRAKGEHYIDLAKDALKREDYGEFAKYIGTGAMLSPGNLEGQRLCADLLFALGRTDDAYTALERSLEYSKSDREHFRGYLRRCFVFDQDQRIILCAQKYMDDESVDPGIQSDLRVAFAQANFLRGNFEVAADFLRKRRLDLTLEGYTLLCQISWEKGDRTRAIERLSDAVKTFPGSDNLRAMLARWHKENGDLEAAKDCLSLLIIRDPSAYSPRVQMLYLMPGEENRRNRDGLVEKLISDFSANELALLELAQFANDTCNPELSGRLLKLATDSRFPSRPKFLLTHVETLTNSGKNKEAIAIVDELFQSNAKDQWFNDMRVTFDSLRTIAYYADGQPDIGAINLKKVMDARNIPPQLLVAVGRKLIQVRRFQEANDTLVAAHLRYENNQALLLQLVKMKVENEQMSDDLEVYLRRLMSTRRPPQEVLTKAYQRIASDRFLFSEGREGLLREINESLKSAKLSNETDS